MFGNLSVSGTGSSHARGWQLCGPACRLTSFLSIIACHVLFPACHLFIGLRNYHPREQKRFYSLGPFPPDILYWLPLQQLWSLLWMVKASADGSLSHVKNRPALADPRNMPVGKVQVYRVLAWLPARLHFTKKVLEALWSGGVSTRWTGGIINI